VLRFLSIVLLRRPSRGRKAQFPSLTERELHCSNSGIMTSHDGSVPTEENEACSCFGRTLPFFFLV
jgi:hypothetical protein